MNIYFVCLFLYLLMFNSMIVSVFINVSLWNIFLRNISYVSVFINVSLRNIG